MENQINKATTQLNNTNPSATSEGLKTQTGDQLQAQPLQENTIPEAAISTLSIRYPSSPDENFYWTKETNSIEHEIRQLLRFESLTGPDIDLIYFDVVKNLETGELRIRLDWQWGRCFQDLGRLDCESISTAIVSLMEEAEINAMWLNVYSVANCAPDILNKTQVAEIINAGLSLSPEVAKITLSEFMEERYEEDESEYGNKEIYNRVF